ncbi:MAG TPA: site-2 protease family protein, partial [Actinomycetota bacterium]|nr:site-2 protease family protein [Actinomycetota bacterium]
MTGVLAIIAFLALILLVVIPVHELGHFLVARRFGFKVEEYFIGFGPRLWSRRRGELEYGIKAIPAGGYVKIAGMNPYETVAPEDLPRAYASKPIWQRALVILAGPGSHFLMGGLLFFAAFTAFGDPGTDRVIVDELSPRLGDGPSPAVAAGLREGDVVVRVGELANPTPDSLSPYVTRFAREHPGEALTYVIERDGRELSIPIVPRLITEDGEERGRIGFRLGPEPVSFPEAAVLAAGQTWRASVTSVEQIPRVFGPESFARTFGLLVSDEPRSVNDSTSIIGVSRTVGDVGSQGDWAFLLELAAYVTIFIGIVNLIPLPPL